VWVAAILSREDSELACDEGAIKQLGDESRLAYGHTLLEMVAIRKAFTGLTCAATTMNSGKRSLKARLNLIIKSPKTFASAIVAVLLISAMCVGCTFTGASEEKRDLSLLNIKTLATVSYQREQLLVSRAPGWNKSLSIPARAVAQYLDSVKWAEKKMSSPLELAADLEIEWDKGHELRFYATEPRLAMVRINEQYRYYTIGQGDYEEALKLLDLAANIPQVSYTLMQLGRDGKVVRATSPLSGDDFKLTEDVVMNYMVKSAAWPGVLVKTLDECYLVRATYDDGTVTDYYAYRLDGNAVMQGGADGYYSRIDDGLYERLVKLAHTGMTSSEGGPGRVVTNVDRSDLEACIYDAILIGNAGNHHSGDLATAAYTLLKTVEHGNTTTAYVMAIYSEFGYSGGGFAQTGGNHMPVAITFEKNASGEHELTEYWTPQDGAHYGPSIRAKFPSDIYDDALDTQKYILAHTQACYDQAIQYGGVDADAMIARLMETITSSPAHMSNPQAYLAAHHIEFREMLYYGAHTLRYCFTAFEQGGQFGLDGHIMAEACRSIMGPAEEIDNMANTGQDWFDTFKGNAQKLHQQNGDDYMAKHMPGSWILLQMLGSEN